MPVHLRGLVELAFWGHLRLDELVALRIEDVDLDAGKVSVRRQVVETDAGPEESAPKAGSQRTVYLPDQGVDALDEHLRVRGSTEPTDRLFARPDGSMLRAHHVHAAWSTARKRAALPDAHAGTHVLLLVQDLDIRVIDAATGELLRELVLDPSRDYQPTGRPPGPARK